VILLKRLLPFLLILGLCLPHAAFAQTLRMTQPNSPTSVAAQANAATNTPANGGLSIDLNGNAVVYLRRVVPPGFDSDSLSAIDLNIEIGFAAEALNYDNFSSKLPLVTQVKVLGSHT